MIRLFKIGLNILFASTILLAIILSGCSKTKNNYNSLIDPNLKHFAHALYLRGNDPFLNNSNIGITPDSLVKRAGKANAYGFVKDTIYLAYHFEIIPLDSFTNACKGNKEEYNLIMIADLKYRFVNNRLESYHYSIYK